MMKLLIVFLLSFMVSGCASTPTVFTAPVEVAKPSFKFFAPAKQNLASISFDWPRLNGYSTIANTSVCIEEAKAMGLDRKSIYPFATLNEHLSRDCAVPAIDFESNIYIGLDQANFNNLINNYNMLLTREKLWQSTLDAANQALKQESK